jgi:uncharacterized membrane protein (DUF106 family)
MRDFLTNLSSVYWWISVVVVGVLINLFSAFLKGRLDNYLSKMSSWWRNRSEARKAKRQKELFRLQNDPEEQTMLALDEVRDRIRSLDIAVFSMTILVVVILLDPPYLMRVFLLALSALTFLVAQATFRRAVSKMLLLLEARRYRKPNEESKGSS